MDIIKTKVIVYKRLKWDMPSIFISRFKKNILIHQEQDRELSVREASKLQCFPDCHIFYKGLNSQQQIADVIPLLLV